MTEFDPLAGLPDEWKTWVRRLPRSTRDSSGNRVPSCEPQNLEGCLIGPKDSSESGNFSDVTTSALTLFAPSHYELQADDLIEIPQGAIVSGRFRVDGKPVKWPAGWQATLREG